MALILIKIFYIYLPIIVNKSLIFGKKKSKHGVELDS